jgi:hypothetical protein
VTDRHDLDATLLRMRDGNAHLLAVVDKLANDDLRTPSALPGWTRAHVGHLARNAEALTRLAHWARTGVETPMYTDGDQRRGPDRHRPRTRCGPGRPAHRPAARRRTPSASPLALITDRPSGGFPG